MKYRDIKLNVSKRTFKIHSQGVEVKRIVLFTWAGNLALQQASMLNEQANLREREERSNEVTHLEKQLKQRRVDAWVKYVEECEVFDDIADDEDYRVRVVGPRTTCKKISRSPAHSQRAPT
mmetsp:Transcript_41892/g.53967  ORF Transcript_41892/g.53967 Transcript_41892/m.53967 type:complete len:121 (+) Transcript_41892:813-1175(+)